MASRENICGGNVVKLGDLSVKLGFSDEQNGALEPLLEDPGNWEAVQVFVDNILIEKNLPTLESAFYVDEDFTSDELEIGEWYVSFADCDLYAPRILTAAGGALKTLGIEPEDLQWTVFG